MSTPVPGIPASATDPRAPEVAWRRMHHITPALKGWKALVALLAIVAYNMTDNIRNIGELMQDGRWRYVVAVVLVIAAVGFLYATIAWRVTKFVVDDEAVHLHTGVLFRQQRQARLDRLQAVDIVQPIVARIFGLAELKLEVAGGAGSAIKLAFLKESEANALRNELLARAAGVVTTEGGVEAAVPPTPPERHVVAVPFSRLIGSIVLTPLVVLLVGFVIFATIAMIVAQDPGVVAALLPALFAAGSVVWTRFNQGFNFRAAVAPDGIRLRHGLTEARSQTLPPGRIQAVRLQRYVLWRWPDWWRVEVNVAGYGPKQGVTETVLLPVGTRDEALLALWLVLPDLGVADPRAFLDAALSGSGSAHGFTTCPRRARWISPLAWWVQGVALTSRAAVLRCGRFSRQVDLIPLERTQSVGISQGPIERRFDVATLELHSTQGSIRPRLDHLAAADVARLAAEVVDLSRAARATAMPEQWLSRVQAAGLAVAGPASGPGVVA